MKKIPVIIAAQLMLSMLPFMSAESVSAEKITSGNMNNIVLFAQYDDPSETNFMAERSDKIVDLCNGGSNFHSLSGYVNTVSYGKLNVTSYFPQMKDGVIIPYDLLQNESDYANCEQYAIEMIQNIQVPKDVPLDGNNDGIVDNVILVVDGKADSMSDPTWPKAFTAPGLTINGKSVGTVNIHNSHQLFENIISGGEGVLCHEFMHSLGYPDLYRNGRTGTPVGMWDIMASNSVFLQYPLAYQRATVSGWLDYKEITKDGHYELLPVSEDKGDRLFILKTPLSDTEFFAVEYRRQGAKYSNEPDVKIYGSGLCVYRVNTEMNGNFKGDMDQIYVFRPDEVSLDEGEGNIMLSNYGGEGAPDHVGSLDLNDGVAEGALVYSNGTNSGIRLSSIKMNGDTISFDIEFAEIENAQLWETIGSTSLGSKLPYDVVTAPDGKVYLITSDGGKAYLYRCGSDGIVSVGDPVGAGSNGSMNSPKLAFSGDTLYLMYRDRDFIVRVCSFDASNGSWNEVYKGSSLAQYADITADENTVYIAYTTGSFPYKLAAVAYDKASGKITPVNCPSSNNICNLSAAVCEGKLLIAYRDITDGNSSKLAVIDAGSSSEMLVSANACGAVEIVSDGKTAVIAPCGANNDIYRYSGGTLTAYKLPDEAAAHAFMQLPVIVNGKIFAAVNTQNPDEFSLYEPEAESFVRTGDIIAREVVNEPSFAVSGNAVYCSYFTMNNTPVVKKLTVSFDVNETVRGDVNCDGKFDIADLVMLQKWVLGSGKIDDWSAGDLCTDGILDAFDIAMMRRELIAKN